MASGSVRLESRTTRSHLPESVDPSRVWVVRELGLGTPAQNLDFIFQGDGVALEG